MDLIKLVSKLWPRVCEFLGIPLDRVHCPSAQEVIPALVYIAGGEGSVYIKERNTIYLSYGWSLGQLVHEMAHAARYQAYKDESEYWPVQAEQGVRNG